MLLMGRDRLKSGDAIDENLADTLDYVDGNLPMDVSISYDSEGRPTTITVTTNQGEIVTYNITWDTDKISKIEKTVKGKKYTITFSYSGYKVTGYSVTEADV